jgi:hypothetical protein
MQPLAPVRHQEITIDQAAMGSTPNSHIVTSGALRLEFDLLFLRQAQDGEGDIVISIEQLQRFATVVWAAAGVWTA